LSDLHAFLLDLIILNLQKNLDLQNFFVSPFVQGLCNKLENTLEGSAEDFFEFEQQIRAIEEFTGKPGDVDYNDSFVKIIGGAQAYLLSDTRYPGEFGFSYPMTIEACRDLDFTRATWDEGIYATDIEPASQSKIQRKCTRTRYRREAF
jgi:hypothetical protein